ncbi:MAG: esterase-like activity of phytase family protein [Coleofasciculaceae cyanobacterium]
MTAIREINFTNSIVIGANTLDTNGDPIGGLSGITYDALNDVYYAISDGRDINGSPGPARFYTFNLTVDPTTGNLTGSNVVDVTSIGNPPPFAANVSDTEGIALTSNGNVFISSEGVFATSSQPFINRFSLTTGQQNAALTIPNKFALSANPNNGIRNNRGFEGLSITPNEQFLFAALENALEQDGPAATANNGSPSRILRYNLSTGNPEAEFVYNTENGNGISEILALDNNTLLVLERSTNPLGGQGSFRLYEASLLNATDIQDIPSLIAVNQQNITAVEKTLVADLVVDFNVFNNFEGMTLGPELADGTRSLILASDNGFGSGFGFPTQLTAFSLNINDAPTLTPVNPNLTVIPEDSTTNNGDLVSSLINNAFADPDPGTVGGIAVVEADTTNGSWEYSIDNGTNWTDFAGPSLPEARLLSGDANTRIRFIPNPNYDGTATISYYAWDGTRGTNGAIADISRELPLGGITAFSTASDSAEITVNAIADAPTLTTSPASGNKDTAILLNILAALVDTDGSENLSIQIANVPTSANLNAGTNLGNGTWQLTPEELANLAITPIAVGDLNLTITAIATETSNNDTASTVANLPVTVADSSSPSSNPNPNPNPNPPDSSLIENSNGVFALNNSGQLLFTPGQINTNLVNEIGFFIVDNAQGNIGSISPGTPGYEQAALNRGQVIFSLLPNNPSNNSPTRQISFATGSFLRFYQIENSTTDAVQTGQTPLSAVSFESPLLNEPNSLNFAELSLNFQETNLTLPLGTELQGSNQAELIDLRQLASQQLQANLLVNSEAAFDNFVGLYAVDDSTGRVGNLNPGDFGYAQAAFARTVLARNLGDESSVSGSIQLEGGTILAPYIIANGTVEEFLAENPNNQPGDLPGAYFAYLAANPDGLDHVRLLGDNTFAFEDLFGGGDADFNDVVLQLHFA